MLVSTKGRYGLRMMIDIACHQGTARVSLREIGERQGISAKYLEQLARLLWAAGLLNGARGQGGGYRLSRAPEDIRVGDIFRATEGTVAPVACLVRGSETDCARSESCETRRFWEGLDVLITQYVDGCTLAELVARKDDDDVVPGPCVSNVAGIGAAHVQGARP